MTRSDERARAGLIACVAATLAFSVYASSLLPGVDLGDTGGFQAAVLLPETSARQAYPLYYGLARPFVLALTPENPARGLNLFSAAAAAVAVGLATFLIATLTGSALAGAAAGLLLAFSHTFWTQAVIAEVYTLHLALITACIMALYYCERGHGWRSLAIFFAVFAVSFGNHLSMILLLVPFTIFLLAARGWRELLQRRIVALAAGAALLAALQYLPAFAYVWTHINAPPGWGDRIAAFWFDVTKADWRGTMVFGTDRGELPERAAMWAWDARLQFGLLGCALALVGLIRLWRTARRWAWLILTAYAMNTAFALTYNVGDPHVFFLPGHLLTALAIGAACTGSRPSTWRPTIAILLIAYAGWRAWDTWPSTNRHGDRRADLLVSRISAGIEDEDAILLSALDWQTENALLYASRYQRPRLAWRRLPDVLLHLPSLVADNQRIGRRVVLAGEAPARITAAYGPLFPMVPDDLPASLADRAMRVGRGTPYVLTSLTPAGDHARHPSDLDSALDILSDGHAVADAARQFQVWGGVAGERPVFHHAADRPFRQKFSLLGDAFEVRMEAWLPVETFRRAGFGHVLRGREPILTVERGVSLVWFDSAGSAATTYANGIYAPRPRFSIPAIGPQQVARATGAMLIVAPPRN